MSRAGLEPATQWLHLYGTEAQSETETGHIILRGIVAIEAWKVLQNFVKAEQATQDEAWQKAHEAKLCRENP
jgi:hypothetical protein